MKTSTTILVIFFALIFLAPFLIAFALTGKVKSGAYTVVNNASSRDRTLSVPAFKVVKIASGSSYLRCSIVKDDSAFVSYSKWFNDSVGLTNVGDTLVVSYRRQRVSDEDFEVTIHTQHPVNIMSEKAAILVFPNSHFADHPLSIDLKNDASLRFVSSPNEFTDDDEDIKQDSTRGGIRFNSISINADSSEVRLPAFLQVQTLTVSISNKSKLLIPSSLKYGQLSATVSDDSEVQAPWRIVKAFRTAAK